MHEFRTNRMLTDRDCTTNAQNFPWDGTDIAEQGADSLDKKHT